ncbi:Cytochrome c' precursor [Beggiatoa sp. PS]|nr:Cytochrome c' precursor [Beggiatoa sp. PS]
MKKKFCVLSFFVLIVFSSAIYAEEVAEETVATEETAIEAVEDADPVAALAGEDKTEFEYLKLVMGVFRSHVKALELLTSKENKYSDNVVRHSIAIWQTTSLLEHFYPGDTSIEHEKLPWKNKKEFEERARVNRKAAKELKGAASEWLEDQDREKFLATLEELKSTCRNCHRELKNWP